MEYRRPDSELQALSLCLKVRWRMRGDAGWLMHTYRMCAAEEQRESDVLYRVHTENPNWWDFLYLSHLHWLQLQPKNVEVSVSGMVLLCVGRRDTLVWSTSAPSTVCCHVRQIWCDSCPGQSKTCFPNLWEDVEEPVIHCVNRNLSLHAEAGVVAVGSPRSRLVWGPF